MPAAERTEVFEVPVEPFYETVIDYKAYPEFVDNVKHVRILKRGEDGVRAKFVVHYIKDFEYVLDLYHEPHKRVHWELARSDLFAAMQGSWTLKKRGKNKTEVTYFVDVTPRFVAPKMIVRALVSSSLPRMMRTFCERALAVHATS